ncbi:hypothetical protein DEO72_LG1g839 [Vigna unguiculata]|uniref:Uncharacterized protein n=1 Tax=Vigna unguiculata TaxID=3917 RepID=A0A4D6KNM6_VIGUN|nr:hypothetical protein DEO72_LG1g838 [Vigna unguiculata]QCD77217.1 hypothetical protein DEO72_LG1g839 [Vigna unguiculata]
MEKMGLHENRSLRVAARRRTAEKNTNSGRRRMGRKKMRSVWRWGGCVGRSGGIKEVKDSWGCRLEQGIYFIWGLQCMVFGGEEIRGEWLHSN